MDAGDQAPSAEYSEDGVDLTLIRWMLSLTPAQRLECLEERVTEILAIRELNAPRDKDENPRSSPIQGLLRPRAHVL
jgi:hypothetical protein